MSFLLDMPGGETKNGEIFIDPYERLRLTPRRQSETLAVAAASNWAVGQPRTCGQAKGVLHVMLARFRAAFHRNCRAVDPKI
ncbi:hypothetical protein CFAM422_004713 [Trichoderma lentiforme]|uniref:Uncharacterized protein n=1 Tax=Trichoderma lentiforme TaxID=1567552 RepID=A0A9P5CD95_9HYPO|nr:hypothetical protein CFAM422_004713 [Trichoderma lentiforme]